VQLPALDVTDHSFICVVTGAGAKKGVGRSTVFELAAHGVACVYACDLDDSNFDDLVKECKEQYPSTEVFPTRSQLTLDYRISIRYHERREYAHVN